MSEKVLVTGGAGFVGSHLVDLLLSEGYSVRVLDDLSFGKSEWVASDAELITGDVTDLETCRRAVSGAAGVFHLAAMSRSGPSSDAVELCTRQNIIGTQNILLASRDAGVSKVVNSASSTYYGLRPPPHREEDPSDFLNPYALSKGVGEQLCELFSRRYGLSTVSLRYFNVYGSRQPRSGAYALVIGIFLEAKALGIPLKIFGDGAQRRDFVHVRDVCRANLLAYRAEARGTSINIGSGTNLSILELAQRISSAIEFGPKRVGDAEVTLADIRRAKELLGWEPTISWERGLSELL